MIKVKLTIGIVLLPCFLLFARVGVDSTGVKNLVSGPLDLNGNVISNASFADSDGSGLTNLTGYATTGTVGAIDVRVTVVETGKVDKITFGAHTNNEVADIQHLTAAEKAHAALAITNNTLTEATSNSYAKVGNQGQFTTRTNYQAVGDYATGTPLYVESYVGTITGGTVTAGAADTFVVTGPNAAVTWDTNAAGADSVSYGTTDSTAYRGDWGASVSGQVVANKTLIDNGPILTNATDVAVGKFANGGNIGVGIGQSANGFGNGVAVGRQADGSGSAVSVGYQSKGSTYGVAVGYNADGYNYGVAVGYNADGYNYGVAVGHNADGYNYGVAVGYNSSAVSNSVAIGQNVANTEPNSTKIKGTLNMGGNDITNAPNLVYTNTPAYTNTKALAAAALPASATNALSVTALQITGTSPTNGAVWIATNTAGQGKWSLPVGFKAVMSSSFIYSNATQRTVTWSSEDHDLGDDFDLETFTTPVAGEYLFYYCVHLQKVGGTTSGGNEITIYASGSVILLKQSNLDSLSVGADVNSSGTVSLNLPAGAPVELRIKGPIGHTNRIYGNADYSFFGGSLIRELP